MAQTDTASAGRPRKSLVQNLEIDLRLLGMVGAFILVCLVFN